VALNSCCLLTKLTLHSRVTVSTLQKLLLPLTHNPSCQNIFVCVIHYFPCTPSFGFVRTERPRPGHGSFVAFRSTALPTLWDIHCRQAVQLRSLKLVVLPNSSGARAVGHQTLLSATSTTLLFFMHLFWVAPFITLKLIDNYLLNCFMDHIHTVISPSHHHSSSFTPLLPSTNHQKKKKTPLGTIFTT
jgi:hypothetical protein